MKNKLHIILLVLITVFIFSCDYFDHRLKIINLTNKDIMIETFSDSIAKISESNQTEYYLANIIKASKATNLTESGTNGWPFHIRRSKNQMLNLCVFSVDSLKKYQTINFLIKYKIYKKYSLTEKELMERDWVIKIY